MTIGEKIRSFRLKKRMTQAELVGDRLTRNMISMIENGKVEPSLSTINYLAERLDVTPGVLLSSESEEFVLTKSEVMIQIRQAFVSGDFRKCLELCRGLGPRAENDDDVTWYSAHCLYMCAHELFLEGKMAESASVFNEARNCALRTRYETSSVFTGAEAHLSLIRQMTGGNVIDTFLMPDREAKNSYQMQNDEWNAFITAKAALEHDNPEGSSLFLSSHDTDHPDMTVSLIRAEMSMYEGNYDNARVILESMTKDGRQLKPVIRYYWLEDYEICCRETNDYKGAYLASKERSELTDSFTK